MKQLAYNYLIRDEMTNIDMLELLRLPKATTLAVNDRGVLLEHDGLYLLSNEPGCALDFLPMMVRDLSEAEDRLVVLHDGELRGILEKDFGFQTVMECYNAVYRSKMPLSYSLPVGAEIRKLDARYVGFVHAHYHMVDDIEYIRERISEDMFGVFLRGEIVGFVGTHDEGSMGLLEILPEYRRLGLAYALEAHLINHLLTQGRVPYCQIAIGNDASIRLQEKLGLTVLKDKIYWLAHKRAK